MICARLIRDEAALAALEERWTALQGTRAEDCVFLTFPWLFLWWQQFRAGELFVVVVEEEGELIGLAPLHLARRRLALGLSARVVRFLGAGEPVDSEYLDILARPDLAVIEVSKSRMTGGPEAPGMIRERVLLYRNCAFPVAL